MRCQDVFSRSLLATVDVFSSMCQDIVGDVKRFSTNTTKEGFQKKLPNLAGKWCKLL